MKKILSFGVVAICGIALACQPASAWTSSKFSFGINWENQSGGNSICRGLWKNGQPPGPEAFGGGGAPAYYPEPVTPVVPVTPAPRASFGSFEYGAPAFAMPAYASPFNFATYSHPVFENPNPFAGR